MTQDAEDHQPELLEAWNEYSARKPTVRAKRPKPQRAYVPVTALAKVVQFVDEMMRVTFTDGRVPSVPLVWFPVLRKATPEQREQVEIGGGGISLHWPGLDERPIGCRSNGGSGLAIRLKQLFMPASWGYFAFGEGNVKGLPK